MTVRSTVDDSIMKTIDTMASNCGGIQEGGGVGVGGVGVGVGVGGARGSSTGRNGVGDGERESLESVSLPFGSDQGTWEDGAVVVECRLEITRDTWTQCCNLVRVRAMSGAG